MKTCLIVDDSSVIRKVARRILEGLDFQIVEAENGEDAIEACRNNLPEDSKEENPVNLDPRMAKLAGGVHRLDGQLMVVLDVDRVLELATNKTSLAA